MELMEKGNLRKVLDNRSVKIDFKTRLTWAIEVSERLCVVSQIVRGLRFLHENDPPIAHRGTNLSPLLSLLLSTRVKKLNVFIVDIKPENVLVDRHNQCKLCDFGLSAFSMASGRDLRL